MSLIVKVIYNNFEFLFLSLLFTINLCACFILERNIKDHFSALSDNCTNVIENAFLMVQLNLANSMDTNLYNYVSFIIISLSCIII